MLVFFHNFAAPFGIRSFLTIEAYNFPCPLKFPQTKAQQVVKL